MTATGSSSFILIHILSILTFISSVCAAAKTSPEAEGSAVPDTLQFVHAIWRHGDRTPLHVCPNDPNFGADKWPNGYGELTEIGLRQSFHGGETSRVRYDGFISRNYSAAEIYIRSTDYNRTLQSAYTFLAGLYSEEQRSREARKLPRLVVPVHTIPQSIDPMLRTDQHCRAADRENKRVQNSPAVLKIMEHNKQFVKHAAEVSGCSFKRLEDASNIQDPLMCEFYHNDTNPWPSWVNRAFYANITSLFHQSSQFWFSSHKLKRLRGGMLLHDILQRCEAVADGKIDRRLKFYGYSAHDTTITAFLSTLGAYSAKVPPYGTVVFVELHKVNSSYELQVYYKETVQAVNSAKGKTDAAKQLKIHGCDLSSCPLTKLSALAAAYRVDSYHAWNEECENDGSSGNDEEESEDEWFPGPEFELIVTCICCVLLALSILLLSVLVRRHVKCCKQGLPLSSSTAAVNQQASSIVIVDKALEP